MGAILDVATIAAAVGKREVSAVAVARDSLSRIRDYAAVQAPVWISRLGEEEVLAAAARIDARIAAGKSLPLAGVPFAIKDNIDLAGIATTAACPDFAYTPSKSATARR